MSRRLLAAAAFGTVVATGVGVTTFASAETTDAAQAEKPATPAVVRGKDPATANKIAQLVAAAKPAGDLAKPTTTSAGATIETAGQVVGLGQTTSTPVVVGKGEMALKIGLPEVSPGRAATATNGTVVYAGDNVSTSVQVAEAGNIRAAVVLQDETAPRDYDFVIDVPAGMSLRLNDGGGIDIVGSDGGPTFGSVDAPWAKDATGRNLPTRYTLNGEHVVQHVETAGAAFPVVADPNVKYNCGLTSCNGTFSRFYTKEVLKPSISGITAAGAILAGALMCGKLPNAAAAAGCAALMAVYGPAAVIKINEASARNQCFTVRLSYLLIASPGAGLAGSSVGVNSDGNCKNR